MLEDLSTDLRPDLPSIKTPAVLLYPFDPATPGPTGAPADSAQTTALYTGAYSTMPHITLTRIENSRHFIMYDQPAAFDAAVQLFLR